MEYTPEKRSRAKTRRTFLAGGTPLQFDKRVVCPYCGESFVSTVDGSAGNQSYYEDCEICCRPILFRMEIDSAGELTGFTVHRDDD